MEGPPHLHRVSRTVLFFAVMGISRAGGWGWKGVGFGTDILDPGVRGFFLGGGEEGRGGMWRRRGRRRGILKGGVFFSK